MDETQMQTRCPESPLLDRARLEGWQFRINRRGYATIVPTPEAVVHGLLWRLTRADEDALDRYEGIREGLYIKHRLRPTRIPNQAVAAMVYLAADCQPGPPRPGYLEGIIAAAQRRGFPEEYVRELERWNTSA